MARILHICIYIFAVTLKLSLSQDKLAIVYLFNVLPWTTNICKRRLPKYFQHTLEQSLATQPDAETYILSNFADWDCNDSARKEPFLQKVTVVDYTKFISKRTKDMQKSAMALAEASNKSGLDWTTSLIRFLILEDFMVFNSDIVCHKILSV